jgi:hypothetical protein
MYFGLVTCRQRWGPSWRGWLLLLMLSAAALLLFALNVQPFFAITERVRAELLVVEGWVDDHAIRAAKNEFHVGKYRDVFTTGGPVHGVGEYINEFSTAASIGAQRLKRDGVPAEHVHMVPARTSARDRTYSSAVALREWLHGHNVSVTQLNVLTEDVHARRTRLLFQKAFGPAVTIGVIAVPNPDYEPRRWWRYSEGVRDVLSETIAYVYARFFFLPAATPPAVATEVISRP